MPTSTAISLLTSAERSASGAGASVDLGIHSGLSLDLAVTTKSGTNPTLDLRIETSKDGVTWRTLDAFPQVTGVGPSAQLFAGADRYVRAVWTLGGTTPAFTFALSGQSLLLYVSPSDVYDLGGAAGRLQRLAPQLLAKHIIAACDQADESLGNRFKLPLAKWPMSLRKHVSQVTAWSALSSGVGVNPQTGDQDLRQRHDSSLRELKELGGEKGKAAPGYVDSTPDVYEGGGGFISGEPRRGWW